MTEPLFPRLHLKKDPRSPWHSRGYIPHFTQAAITQSITFRLADSLPAEIVRTLKRALSKIPLNEQKVESRKQYEYYLHQGHGSCILKHDSAAKIIRDAFQHFDGERYRLLAWVIMPNHVHVMIECMPDHPLHKIIHAWKSFSARSIKKLSIHNNDDQHAPFWQRDYWDRYIRNESHYITAKDYIEHNPVQAHLCHAPEQWRWSSAWENKR